MSEETKKISEVLGQLYVNGNARIIGPALSALDRLEAREAREAEAPKDAEETCNEIAGWWVGGYQSMGIDALERYVQSRIAAIIKG